MVPGKWKIMVYYRKYRPQKISDLDSTAVRETLQSVLKKNIPHAFLFTGPKGLGKTSTARIVAKVVNCVGKKPKDSFEPCNECEQCVSITNGNNLDVLEIDAASNRGIDEIRDLKEKIRLAPVSAKKKVYIIDEVHMLTTEAFNALLKTLEEPPEHAMFILATTEPHKIPATILSRCFHVNFSLATDDEIVRALQRAVSGEKLQVDDEALFAIARMADGGFRDAVKLLEEVVLQAGDKKITREVFESSFKSGNVFGHVEALLGALKQHDVKAGLEVVKVLVEQGMDIKYFLQQVIEELHTLLLAEVGIKSKETRSKNVGLTSEETKALIGLFTQAFLETRNAVIPQLPLELAIIEWCTNVIPNGTTRSQRVEALPGGRQESHTSNSSGRSGVGDPSTSVGMTADQGITVSTLRKQVGAMKKTQALYGTPKKVKEEKVTVETTTNELHHAPGDGTITQEWLEVFWRNFISEMKNHNHTAAGVLRSCQLQSYDKKTLVISTAYKFHKERLDDFKTKDALVTVCKLLTGKTVEVAIELKR